MLIEILQPCACKISPRIPRGKPNLIFVKGTEVLTKARVNKSARCKIFQIEGEKLHIFTLFGCIILDSRILPQLNKIISIRYEMHKIIQFKQPSKTIN